MYRLLLVFILVGCASGMTREQVKKTMGVIKKQCMPKHSVTEDQVGNIEQGHFPEDRNVKCYVTCIYKNLQVIKNDQFDSALISKQADILYPPNLKEPLKKAVATCIHVQDQFDDVCDKVYSSIKCLYEKSPEAFIFP